MPAASRPSSLLRRSLSARLLVLTVAFVMLSEVLIYVPSIARFRLSWLEQRLEAAHLASLALLEAPDNMVSAELAAELLQGVGARAVVLKLPRSRVLVLGEDMPPEVDATFDLRQATAPMLIGEALLALAMPGDRMLRVVDGVPRRPEAVIEVVVEEAPLQAAMYDYSGRILTLSIIISLLTAGLVFASLHRLLVRPMRRITASMTAFRQAPEDATRVIVPSGRQDEVGVAERELSAMQRDLRAALHQKTRLAALGAAVSKVNHDLRNILATAQVVSDRLTTSDDPTVRGITPRLVDSIDRAISLCTRTLRFGRADEPLPERSRFRLAALVDEVAQSVGLPADNRIEWRNTVPPDLTVDADREQIFRVLLNLGRNAVQAIAGRGEIVVAAALAADGSTSITVRDTGPGLPEAVRQRLFEPFAGAGRAGGTGLGLAIARDLMRAHGGDIELAGSGSDGTCFRLRLPPITAD